MIRVVTRWAGSNHATFIRNATAIRDLWLKHGAIDLMVAKVFTGPDVNQFEVTTTFRNWITFAAAMEALEHDVEYEDLMARSHANGTMISRTILTELDRFWVTESSA